MTTRPTHTLQGTTELRRGCKVDLFDPWSLSWIVDMAASQVIDKSEAQRILRERLARFSSYSHSELARLVEAQHVEAY